MKSYSRRLTPILMKEIEKPDIVVLTGMRQVGKTTLSRQVFDSIDVPDKLFLDLENPLNQKIFEEENFDNIVPNLGALGFSPSKRSFIFLDEVQLAPKIVRVVKYLYDRYKIKFFLTGSSSFYLKNLFSESLAGRKIIYELFPLDFEEFLVFNEKEKKFLAEFSEKEKNKNKISYQVYKKLFEEYMEFGGFPRVVIEKERERKRQILEDIWTSYFEKDIKALADFKELGKMRDLILLLARRVGSKLDVSKLASEIGISRDTIYSYLNFLEKTYFIFLIGPFSHGINGEVRGAKKIYFCDGGLLNYLGRVNEGAIFEQTIFQCLKKFGDLNYYERYKGSEVDFVLNKEIAFEVKTKGNVSDVKRLCRISENLKLKEHYLIVQDYFDFPCAIMAQDM